MIEFSHVNILEDIGVKTIRTVVNELVKLMGESIWDTYKVIEQHSVKDNVMNIWIQQMVLNPVGGQS